MYTREEFENLINNSPLFDVDKINNSELYKSEKYKFTELLTQYYQVYIYPHKLLEDYSYTLIETATECIKYYDRAKGEFLHLFNKALKRDLGIAKAKEMIETRRQGIRLSIYDEQMISKVLAFAKSKNLDIYDSAIQAKIGLALGIRAEELENLIQINDNAIAVASTVTNDDGDEIELFDLLADKDYTPEEAIVSRDGLQELVSQIDNVFQTVQERQKKLLSLLLTAEIVKALACDIKETEMVLDGCSFFNVEIIDWYKKHGGIPTAKQIGEMCGVSEQSLSRAYKNFKEKLRKNC